MKKIAKLLNDNVEGFPDAHLYEMTPRLDGHKYVIISAAIGETYIFPASKKGEIKDWGELEGSFKGSHDHVKALRNAGYSLKETIWNNEIKDIVSEDRSK